MANKVSVLDKDGAVTEYSTYAAARAAIISEPILHPLIQIWATLTNEQIVLLNGVDIWIAPGVEINSGSSDPTIVAPTTGVVNCKIYGQGKVKNDTSGNCIFIDNANAKLIMECDTIEGTGGSGTSVSVNVHDANTFHLTCNKVYNKDWQAVRFGELLAAGLVHDVNLNITRVETGNLTTPYTGTTALTMRGNGFIKIDEILCRNRGHCLSQREGSLTAEIRKITTITRITGNSAALLICGKVHRPKNLFCILMK